MTEKYLYFAKKDGHTQTISSQAGQTYTITTALINPLPDGRANTSDIFEKGKVTMTYDNLRIDDETPQNNHLVGAGYGTLNENDQVLVDASALSYDGVNAITVQTVSQNPRFGITASATAGENDATFKVNVPMVAGEACVWPATAFLGVHMVDNDTADIYFEPQTNDGVGGGVDKVRLSYRAGEFKALSQLMHDVCADSRNQGEMIVIADTFRGIYHGGNPAGITAVDSITLDT